MASVPHDLAPDASLVPGIRQHLEDVVSSPAFAKSRRLAAFLRWVVEQEIAGNRAQIAERNLASLVYKRGPDFDPRLDGTIRAEAMRLRNKLREYYEGADPASPRIAIPKGGYFPVFTGFEPAPIPAGSPVSLKANMGPVFTGFELAAIPAAPEPVGADSIAAPIRPRSSFDTDLFDAIGRPIRPRPLRVAVAVAAVVAMAMLLVSKPSAPRPNSQPAPADIASAAQLLDRARSLWRAGENPGARDVLERGLADDSGNARMHLLYSAVLQNLGYDERTRAEAVRASHLAVASGEADDLAFEGRVRAANGDWPAAVRAYRFLIDRNPRDFEAALGLADAQMGARDLPGCVATVARARNLPEGLHNPELERLDALCRASMDDNASALQAVKRGEGYAEAAGLRGSLSRLILLDAGITQNLGGNSPPLLAQAHALCNELHDEICLVKVSRVSANRMVAATRFPEAVQLYKEALPVAERLHNSHEMGLLVSGLTLALEQMGDLRAADSAYAHYAAVSAGVAVNDQLPLRAQFAYLRGDLGESEVLVGEAISREGDGQTPSVEASERLLLALIEIERADLAGARATLRRAGELVRRYGGAVDQASLHTESALVESAAGNWDRAVEEIAAADRLTGPGGTWWYDTRIAALRIRLWRGDYRYILEHAAGDAAELTRVQRLADAAEALALLAEAEFRTGDADKARAALDRAKAGTTADSPLLTRLAVLRASILASRDVAEADRIAAEASQLASRAGFRIELYEARLTREERRLITNHLEALGELGRMSEEMDRAGLHGLVGRSLRDREGRDIASR